MLQGKLTQNLYCYLIAHTMTTQVTNNVKDSEFDVNNVQINVN